MDFLSNPATAIGRQERPAERSIADLSEDIELFGVGQHVPRHHDPSAADLAGRDVACANQFQNAVRVDMQDLRRSGDTNCKGSCRGESVSNSTCIGFHEVVYRCGAECCQGESRCGRRPVLMRGALRAKTLHSPVSTRELDSWPSDSSRSANSRADSTDTQRHASGERPAPGSGLRLHSSSDSD